PQIGELVELVEGLQAGRPPAAHDVEGAPRGPGEQVDTVAPDRSHSSHVSLPRTRPVARPRRRRPGAAGCARRRRSPRPRCGRPPTGAPPPGPRAQSPPPPRPGP